MKNTIKKIKTLLRKKEFIFFNFILFLSLFIVVLLFPNMVHASTWIEAKLLNGAAALVYAFVWFLGLILIYIIHWLAIVASYNDFINVETVKQGWMIVRDLCNMFFVLILLVIAFATILKIENYNVKKLLPKLLIMAVLINFSKTICGLIIDFAQVIMMTFVNGFAGGGINNLADILGMKHMLAMAESAGDNKDITLGTWGGILVALFAAIVACIVITVTLCVLLMRVIMLWVYVILSPLAFLLSAFPAGQKYSSQWWSEFSKQVVVGPILAFFLWLALTTASGSSDRIQVDTKVDTSNFESSIPSGFLKDDIFQTYIITLALLIGGLIVTQQMGGMAGAAAGKGMAAIQKGRDLGIKGALLPAKGIGTFASFGVDKLHQKTGVDLNLSRAWKGMNEKRAENRATRYAAGQVTAGKAMDEGGRIHGMLAMTGAPGDAWDQVATWKGLKPTGIMKRLRGGKGGALTGWMAKGAKEKQEEIGLDQSKFEAEFSQLDANKKGDMLNKITHESYSLDDEINRETDNNKKQKLEKQRDSVLKKINFASENNRDFSEPEIMQYKDTAEEKQKQFNKYTPAYNFEARAADQKVVNEKTSKIQNVSDANELLRILEEAINDKDKAMIKAITKKMAKEGNDNEYLQKFGGDSGYKGLHKFMNDLQKDAGFGEQESMALGSEIAEINKGTNHWGATSAYMMENGRWREATGQEHAQIRTVEIGKMHQQAVARNVNRLGYGSHDKQGNFHMDASGVLTLNSLNNAKGLDQIRGNMNESSAKHIYQDISDDAGNLKSEFVGKIKDDVFDAVKDRVKSLSLDSFEDQFNNVQDI